MKKPLFNSSNLLLPVLIFVFFLNGCQKSDKEAKVTQEENKSKITERSKIMKINTKESIVEWIGKKVTGQHNGNIKINSGEFNTDGGRLISGKIEIDMGTIVCLDLTDKSTNDKLIGHLKSDDFFSVEKFPYSNFEITDVKEYKNSDKPEFNSMVSGNLTIKGITKGISFPASITIKDGILNASADFDVDRTEWNVRYGSGKFFQNLGDKLINDNFNIKFKIKAS